MRCNARSVFAQGSCRPSCRRPCAQASEHHGAARSARPRRGSVRGRGPRRARVDAERGGRLGAGRVGGRCRCGAGRGGEHDHHHHHRGAGGGNFGGSPPGSGRSGPGIPALGRIGACVAGFAPRYVTESGAVSSSGGRVVSSGGSCEWPGTTASFLPFSGCRSRRDRATTWHRGPSTPVPAPPRPKRRRHVGTVARHHILEDKGCPIFQYHTRFLPSCLAETTCHCCRAWRRPPPADIKANAIRHATFTDSLAIDAHRAKAIARARRLLCETTLAHRRHAQLHARSRTRTSDAPQVAGVA